MNRIKKSFINFILPGIILPGIIGLLAGSATFFYKWASEELVEISYKINDYITTYYWLIPIVIIILIGIAFVDAIAIGLSPMSKGGGIPTSEGIIRGTFTFNPFLTLIFTVLLSFVSYMIGLPLGSEGPSVAIGTSIGGIANRLGIQKTKAFDRYLMTAGASASFAVATASPISGIIFALEEVHRKFSPLLLLVSFSSVVTGTLAARLLCSGFDVSYRLFEEMSVTKLPIRDYWYLIILAVVIGLLAIGFNYLIKLSQHLQDKTMAKVPQFVKISISFVLTIIISIFIPEVLNSGRSLVLGLFIEKYKLMILIVLLILKVLMIAWISQSGATGGMFIPILTVGALIGAIFAMIFKLDKYAVLIITMSMAAFLAASVGCPLSALVFSFEALSASNTNILAIAIVVLVAYAVTRVLNSVNTYDIVLERKLHSTYDHRDYDVVEIPVTVKEGSFAQDKQVRDLLLSANMLVISIKRKNKRHYKMDNFGDKFIRAEDEITFRCQTYDINKTRDELETFFGVQDDFNHEVKQEYRRQQ